MQMPGAHVDQAADVAVGAHHRVHFMGLQQSGFIAVSEAAQFFGVFGETFQIAGLVGQVAITPGQVAGNLKPLDSLSDDFHRFQAHEFHLAHAVGADHVGELIQAMANPANQLPAIAAAGAPADLMGFEQHHAQATFSQFQRCIQPGEPAADHANVSHQFAGQHRMLGLGQAAGGIIRGGVLVIRGRLLSTAIHVRDPDSCVWKI